MIRLSVALNDEDSWLFSALELAQNASRSRGPTASKGQIIRDILTSALAAYKPQQVAPQAQQQQEEPKEAIHAK